MATTVKNYPAKKECACGEHLHECKEGKHEWFVTRWRTVASQKEALEVSCRFCLKKVDVTKMANCEIAEQNQKARK